MVVLDKYHDDDVDAPPSYDTITSGASGQSSVRPDPLVNEKSPRQSGFTPSRNTQSIRIGPSPPKPPQSSSSSWLSLLSFASSRTSNQVRQTVLSLVRDLVTNPQSPDILDSCADACRAHGLDLSALIQEPSIEDRSAIYWAIVNRRESLLPSLLAHAIPLTSVTVSDIRLGCLVTSNETLFQALRCQRDPFAKQKAPLSTRSGADTLVLGSTPADDISIRELGGEGAFVADMRISLWQKRMRISGRVSVEFIARGRIWSLTFFSAPSTGPSIASKAVGTWQVALCLLEHSPPTFIDSRLVVDISPPSSNPLEVNDLILLSPSPPEATSNSPGRPPASLVPSPPQVSTRFKSKFKSRAPRTIEVRLKSTYRLAYRSSNFFLTALDAAFSGQKDSWVPPRVDHWSEDGVLYTNAIVVPLGEGAGAELLYDNTPFIAADGTLHVRLDARLGKPEATDCIIC
ncbi:hypothetical protein PAXRUDRAFT_482147 [Paxillus rubicundulus Ve08.2h10]|uniref:Uncharacterized protein n=1 Tax=Paxillus rubicundulus Ve08.2h10 TaxID=930991 RepID=A0A0D0DA41_9AGAM|nr:hypothetical protein PAXRUDRAFT_482147 [Paxillus rubicundulus Ve08.2h10]